MKGFDRIIGYASIKDELMRIADALQNKDAYRALGVDMPNGLLLHGVPGVGKSNMAMALIEASGWNAFICRKIKSDGEFVDMIRDTFRRAAENEPSIVLLDDMDKFSNSDDMPRDCDEYVAVQACIDETRAREVFVLATANSIRQLPSSLKRVGRFDRIIEIDTPTGEDAVQIVAHYLKSKNLETDLDARTIAEIMQNCSCAELETVINEAGLLAGYQRALGITMDHIIEACLKVVHEVPTSFLKDRTPIDLRRSLESARIIWHEAGHAVLEEILYPGNVALVFARCCEDGRYGFTKYKYDRSNRDVRDIKGNIIAALGGRAAVEEKLRLLDTGALRDLEMAFENADSLITEHCCEGLHLSCYLDNRPSEGLKESQEQAEAVLVEYLYQKAKEILHANLGFLDAVANELAKKGVLVASDIARIREGCVITPAML